MVSWWPTVMEIRQSGTPCRYAEGVEGIAIFTDLQLDPTRWSPTIVEAAPLLDAATPVVREAAAWALAH